MTEKLTVIIPCKNERGNIRACVESARRVADEVLIADSGSTDGTLELAHALADRVIERDYVDSGDFKNWAIPQATYSWVLVVDADERITVDLAKEVRATVAVEKGKDAYSIPRRNFFLGHPLDHGDWAGDRVIRLFRRDLCRYECYTDHAEIDVAKSKVGVLKNAIVHYTAWNLVNYLSKMTHYAEQQADMWHAQGKRPKLIHIALNAPMRFLRGYVWRLGFLDGTIGFLVAALTAYYSFLKQLMFWQRAFGRTRRDIEGAYATDRTADGKVTAAECEPIGSFDAA